MSYFSPETFAVCGEPAGSKLDLPGKPLSMFGTVRDVDMFNNRNDMIRCVCFTLREMGEAIGVHHSVGKKIVWRGVFPAPIYPALCITQLKAQTKASSRFHNTYLYPEIVVMRDVWQAIHSGRNKVSLIDREAWLKQAALRLRTIRQEVGETLI